MHQFTSNSISWFFLALVYLWCVVVVFVFALAAFHSQFSKLDFLLRGFPEKPWQRQQPHCPIVQVAQAWAIVCAHLVVGFPKFSSFLSENFRSLLAAALRSAQPACFRGPAPAGQHLALLSCYCPGWCSIVCPSSNLHRQTCTEEQYPHNGRHAANCSRLQISHCLQDSFSIGKNSVLSPFTIDSTARPQKTLQRLLLLQIITPSKALDRYLCFFLFASYYLPIIYPIIIHFPLSPACMFFYPSNAKLFFFLLNY